MKFSELSCCPFCGGKQFYTHNYMHGSAVFHQRFDGEDAENNEGMYDGLTVDEGARAYCSDCENYLGNLTIDEIGKHAERALKGGEGK